MANAQVSIIMPAKNAEKYIKECLSSIMGQTFSFWELIIVNDHSSDNTVSIISEFATRDSRIKLYKNKGQGIIPALQTAFSHCNGEFITRMDADDVMPVNRLELMVDVLKKSSPKTIVTGKVKYFGDASISEGYTKYENWLNERIEHHDQWKWVYRECVIASPNWMLRREELDLDALSYPEDYDLVLRWYQQGFQIRSINEVTLNWREHPERTSRNSHYYQQPAFFKLKIEHFIKCELTDHQLILWGSGKKAELTARILNKLGVKFIPMDMVAKEDVQHFTNIESIAGFKLLIAVYPEESSMKKMLRYLNKLNLEMGEDYWFL